VAGKTQKLGYGENAIKIVKNVKKKEMIKIISAYSVLMTITSFVIKL